MNLDKEKSNSQKRKNVVSKKLDFNEQSGFLLIYRIDSEGKILEYLKNDDSIFKLDIESSLFNIFTKKSSDELSKNLKYVIEKKQFRSVNCILKDHNLSIECNLIPSNSNEIIVTLNFISANSHSPQDDKTKIIEEYPDDIVTVTTTNGAIQYVNPAFENITGYKMDEVIGRNPQLLNSGSQTKQFYQNLWDTILKGETFNAEIINKKKTGELYYEKKTISPLKDNDGNITHFVSIGKNIAYHSLSEKEPEPKDVYSDSPSLPENTENFIWTLDKNYKIQSINAQAKQLFIIAFQTEFKVGDVIIELIPHEQKSIWLEWYSRAFSGGYFTVEEKFKLVDIDLYLEIAFNPIYLRGKITGVSVFARDISQRKIAEEELTKNQQFLQTLIDNLPIAIASKSADDERFLLWNKACEKMLDIKADIILGQKGFELFPHRDISIFKQESKTPFEEKRIVEIPEEVINTPSQGMRIYKTKRVPVFDSNGKPLHLLIFSEDITENKKAEWMLRQREERYRSLVELASDGIFIFDADWNIKSANTTGFKMLGYEKYEILNRNLREFVFEQDIISTLFNSDNLRSGKNIIAEMNLIHKKGSLIPVEVNSAELKDGLFQGIFRDITERKRVEKALEEEHKRSEALLYNILPISVADRLKTNPGVIADEFKDATILFADLVDFTRLSEKLSAEEVISLLNNIFSTFDDLADKYSLEKIKTIGDEYMVTAGLPVPRRDHAQAIANMAIEMRNIMSNSQRLFNLPLNIRIGINSGPAVAGVIGKKKFIYDLWGNAVNMASRMESHGIPGKIQVSESTYMILKNDYYFTERGTIIVKGDIPIKVYFLEDKL